ncbi:fungal-specific transcription factor domain-containing protein [Xylariaceae sp. FL0594]|nr:fungal-specific transcription factor domain-containing protein [Xylariaceae sp. FL0594]
MRPGVVEDGESKKSQKMRPPMRSSIACTKCRKSKIKCENSNGTSPCDSCIKTGSECIFKVPDPLPSKRAESPVVVKQERDGGSDRKRSRKTDGMSKVDGQRATAVAEDVLSASFLTEDVWEQVLDLYKLHFAPELPFLHLPTMKEKLGRRSKPAQESSNENNSDSNLVLLSVLTLTARFHPDLVRYTAHIHNSQAGSGRGRPPPARSDPAAASEYYADVLAVALGPVRTIMGTASVDRVAALLMLGLYEWSQTQPKSGGMTAWMYVGSAIRMAQFLGLGFEDAKEPGDAKFRAADRRLKNAGCQSQLALQKEIRRRIMFSCFILDRMLACGKHRVSIIRGEDLDIQLPCSEDKFDLAMEVQTGRLTQMERPAADDSVLSRFVQLVNIWGEISKYSSRGGRVKDKHPPWHPESDFYNLNKALQTFDSCLPGTFTFSKSNYFKHENHQASSTFVLLHMLRFVSLIMLHREYVPFVPIRCGGPEGPLDQPTFTEEETPAGFWEASAAQLFKAARGIVDLIQICQRKDRLPQSTIVLFAIWTACFVGLYGVHFPQMDKEGHMRDFDFEDTRQDGVKEVFKRGTTALTFQTLLKMATWQKMASTYVDILQDMNDYFDMIKQDYYRFIAMSGQHNSKTLRVREGGTGGGLEEYQPLDKKLKDFGSLLPDEPDVVHISQQLRVGNLGQHQASGEIMGESHVAPSGSFRPINRDSALHTPEPNRQYSTPTESAVESHQHVHPDAYADSWRHHHHHGASPHQTQTQTQTQTHSSRSPAQSYLTPSSIIDPANNSSTTGHAQQAAYGPSMTDAANFWSKLGKDELRRFGTTGDLSLFSTGQSEVPIGDMPFGDSSTFRS